MKFRKPLCPPGQSRATTTWQEAVQLERDVIEQGRERCSEAEGRPNAAFMSSVNCFSTVAKSPATIAARIPRVCGTTSHDDPGAGIGACNIVATIRDATINVIGQS